MVQWWAAFAAWLRARGGEWPQDAVWKVSDEGTVHGCGLLATVDTPKGTELFQLSPGCLVSAPDRFELAEWLLRERIMAVGDEGDAGGDAEDGDDQAGACPEGDELTQDEPEDSDDWTGYLLSLPNPSDSKDPRSPTGNMFYDTAVASSPGDPLAEQAIEFAPGWVEELGLQREWLLSLALVSSRVHHVWSRDAFGDWVVRPSLVPLADLLNGAADGAAGSNVQCETRKKDAYFVCSTTRRVVAGQEFLVAYGDAEATRGDLQRTYGDLL